MRLGLGAIVALSALLSVSTAGAAQRFAAPAGSGSECTKAAPCALPEAVGGAHAGDEVIVTGGSYAVGATIGLPSATNVQVHGDTGGPPPKLTATILQPVMEMYKSGDSISYLEIEDDADGGTGIYCTDGKLERVRVRVVGDSGTGVLAYPDCNSVRNSLLLTEGAGSKALRSVTNGTEFKLPVRNVTAISAGTGSSGMVAEYAGASPGSLTLELENSIVQGGQQDLRPIGNVNGAGIIAAGHSNFDTANPISGGKVIDAGGNQTASPLFVNSEGGDYREGAGSPTIDAGVADQLGTLDLAGDPRVQGSAPDIGAFEFVPLPPAKSSRSRSSPRPSGRGTSREPLPAAGRKWRLRWARRFPTASRLPGAWSSASSDLRRAAGPARNA